jgi:A/G-specific adenine glycosylase
MLGSAPTFADRLLAWYDVAQRKLPWRVTASPGGRPDPYHVLVSELMLQQTQVATVVPYFHRFLARFPTMADLAAAPEQDVLRLWQGLGYYSRARNLQRAARQVMADHGGTVPCDLEHLLALPGVGRYTAGALASIAFDRRAPILDGNVVRVLCRLDNVPDDPRDRLVQGRLWARAEAVLPPTRAGDFNSALMELGATVCAPRNPQCLICPVRDHCEARAAGTQEQIPPPKKGKPTPLERRVVLCVRRGDRWLIEQRPTAGRWAAMWQFVTRSRPARSTSLVPPVPVDRLRRLGTVAHALTHRRYEFDVRWGTAAEDSTPPAYDRPHAWVTLDGLTEYPLPKPHLAVAAMLREVELGPKARQKRL